MPVLFRKGGHVAIDPDRRDEVCHICESAKDVQFVRFDSPGRAKRRDVGGPGEVYLRICGECLWRLHGSLGAYLDKHR